jgi:hypothetical protein
MTMEFDNVHEEVADLRMRVEKLEARLETANQIATAALAEIQHHEAETEPAVPAAMTETTDGETHHEESEQDGDEVVRGAEPVVSDSR